MGDHDTWLSVLIPAVKNLELSIAEGAGKSWIFGKSVIDVHHVTMGVFTFIVLIMLALRFRSALKADAQGGVIPEAHFNMRSIIEVICDYTYGTMSGVMGEKAARHFLPFIGTFGFFILLSNLLGLVPGLLPATDSVNTTAACAVLVFIATHWYGVRENGLGHFKHMMGPVWWLAWLVLPIELISHLARPVSLALRLAGNMFGDHMALMIFLKLTLLVIPVALLALGLIVCMVQTMVFCLLSAVYIGMAIEHHDHAEAH